MAGHPLTPRHFIDFSTSSRKPTVVKRAPKASTTWPAKPETPRHQRRQIFPARLRWSQQPSGHQSNPPKFKTCLQGCILEGLSMLASVRDSMQSNKPTMTGRTAKRPTDILLTMGWYTMLAPLHMEEDQLTDMHVSAKRCSNLLSSCMTLRVPSLSSKSSCWDLGGAKPARLPFPDSFEIPKWSTQQRPAHGTQTSWWWRFVDNG